MVSNLLDTARWFGNEVRVTTYEHQFRAPSSPTPRNHNTPPHYEVCNSVSILAISVISSLHLSHSPYPIPRANGNLPPSGSPKFNTRLTASLIPTTPNLTINSSARLIRYCSSRTRSSVSLSSGSAWVTRVYKCTTVLGNIAARPSTAPQQPTCRAGKSCWPRPVKRWKFLWSICGSRAICAWTEMSPCESLPPTMLRCEARLRKRLGGSLTLLLTPG